MRDNYYKNIKKIPDKDTIEDKIIPVSDKILKIVEMKEGDKGIITYCDDKNLIINGLVKDTYFEIYKHISGVTCIALRGTVIAFRNSDIENVYAKLYNSNINV